VELLDPDPGGFPPGRLPGEEGATRCWCFMVEAEPQCPPAVGMWDWYYDWDCDGDPGNTWVELYSDGTFLNGEGGSGTWYQDGCNFDLYFESQTHYWGVMTIDGMYMEGEMETSGGSMWGCWWANRTSSKVSGSGEGSGFTMSSEPIEAID
jgi:hypothetical protein